GVRPWPKVEGDLMSRRRRDGGYGAGKTRLNRAMHMTADDSFHPRVTSDNVLEGFRVSETHHIHMVNAGGKRRMMHEDQRWLVGLLGEAFGEPGKARRAKNAAGLARIHRVQPDQPKRPPLDGVVQELALDREVAGIREGRTQGAALVVISRNDEQ